MTQRILVIGPRLAPLAARAFPHAAVETVDPTLGQGLPSPAQGFDLLLVDAEAAPHLLLIGMVEAMALRPEPAAVILAGAHLPAALVRAVVRLPRADVLDAPFTQGDLQAAAKALTQPAANGGMPAASRCWAVTGAVGGAGATTVAVEIAANLAGRSGAERSVALVDLNLVDGQAAAYVGGTAGMLLAEASGAAERIDAAVLEAFAVRVGRGLDLLAAPRDPNAFSKVSSEAVTRVLEVACQVYDFVVVDLPRHRQPWTLDVLAGSDELLVVSELTVPALLAAKALAGELEAGLPAGPRPRIVLNRLASRLFGPAPSLTEAERALGRKADGGVTSDWEAAAASVNLGGTIAQHRPRSKIVRDIDALVERLLDPATAQEAAA